MAKRKTLKIKTPKLKIPKLLSGRSTKSKPYYFKSPGIKIKQSPNFLINGL